MICDLCDKYQQNICERTFHFIKPINECLMKKAQENKQIIEELEKIKQEIQSIIALADSRGEDTKLAYQCQIAINERISELKGEHKNDE